MTPLLAVLKKELRDSFRDKRSVAAALAISFLGPLIIAFALGAVAEKVSDVTVLLLPVQGANLHPIWYDFWNNTILK